MQDDTQGETTDLRTHLEWLREEVPKWEADRLIGHEAARMLLARYGLEGTETTSSLKYLRIVHILAALGAILVGVGIILVVGANWEEIPRWLRVVVLIGCTALAYAAGYYLAFEKQSYQGVGASLILLGSILWGASIFLIAQSFQIPGGQGGEATAVFYWFIGTLPLAYVLRSSVQLALSAIIGTVWLGMVWFDLVFWAENGVAILSGFVCLSGLIYVIGKAHQLFPTYGRLGRTLEILGTLYLLWALYLLAFSWELGGGSPTDRTGLYLAAGIVLGCVLIAVWAYALRSPSRYPIGDIWYGALVSCVGFVILLAVFFRPQLFPDASHGDWSGAMALFNLLLLAVEVGVVALGWNRLDPALVNIGLAAFFIHLITRYFDTIGRQLSGGLAFVGAGIVLLGAGYLLEKQRKVILGSISAERRLEGDR